MPDETKVSETTAKEIVRLSELYIDGTLRMSLAGDSRAMQLSGVLAASSTALLVASIGFIFRSAPIDPRYFATGIALIVAAIFFMLALANSLAAASPRHFNVGGNYLDHWSSDEDLYGPLSNALVGQAGVYRDQIKENKDILRKRAGRISTALWLIGLAPVLAFGAGGLTYFKFDSVRAVLATIGWSI
jgi:hypothetical protein